tara:strand:- start:1362 stop:1649 length:288 start_codon:yes stop_codon:yes gene_type:complete
MKLKKELRLARPVMNPAVRTQMKSKIFERIINIRVTNALKEIEKIGKCSDTNRYNYTKKDVSKIFNALEKAMKTQKQKFVAGLKKDDEVEFKLND